MMGENLERNSNNMKVREEETEQPPTYEEKRTGFGNKKLEGPNRPST
jgi:hypothetical protein